MAFFCHKPWEGPSDGIGGTVKREAAKASLQRTERQQILSALDLFHFVQDKLPGIEAEFVTAAERSEEENIICDRFHMAKTIL